MLRPPHHQIFAFDAEWVPDPATGRRVLDLPGDLPDEAVIERMWAYGGATEAESPALPEESSAGWSPLRP